MPTPLQDLYLIWSAKYIYVARYAALQLDPVLSGYQYHLGLEFLLKAALINRFSTKQLKYIGHDLMLLWHSVKGLYSPTDLNAHDFVIEALNEFGDIRYPDQFLGKNVVFNLRINVHAPGLADSIAPGARKYEVDLAALDNVVLDLFKLIGVPTAAYFKGLNQNHIGAQPVLSPGFLQD